MTEVIIEEAGQLDLTIPQGGTWSETFEYVEDDETTPRPLTGFSSGKAQIRTHPGGDLLGEMTVDIDVDAGTVTLSMTAEQTRAIPRGGFYDVALIHDDGVTVNLPFIEGAVILDTAVTVIEEGGS